MEQTRLALNPPASRAPLLLCLVIAVVAGACTVSLKTRSDPPTGGGCVLGAIGGVLRTDFTWGLAVDADGTRLGVIWPFGYTARRDSDGVALIDRAGKRVAVEGDSIEMAGTVQDGVLHPCDPPDLRVLPGEKA